MCVCVHSHKVSADFYDPARRVGAEVKHVKNVKELYMVHDYIQRVTRAYGEPPLHWYVILFGGAANSVTYDIPEGNWERVYTVLKTWGAIFQIQSKSRGGLPHRVAPLSLPGLSCSSTLIKALEVRLSLCLKA